MAKKLDFDKEKNNRNDNVIEEIMQADFPLPKQAEDAKNEAFARIREMALPKFQSPTDTNWDSIRFPIRTNFLSCKQKATDNLYIVTTWKNNYKPV